jgi:hypothetical protein
MVLNVDKQEKIPNWKSIAINTHSTTAHTRHTAAQQHNSTHHHYNHHSSSSHMDDIITDLQRNRCICLY